MKRGDEITGVGRPIVNSKRLKSTHGHSPKQLRQIMFIVPLLHRLIHKPATCQLGLQAALVLRMQCQVKQRVVDRVSGGFVASEDEDESVAENFIVCKRACRVAF